MHFVPEICNSWTSKTKNVRFPFQLFLLFTVCSSLSLFCVLFLFFFLLYQVKFSSEKLGYQCAYGDVFCIF